MQSVLYTHLTPTDFRLRLKQAPIAYLPLGTLEWHSEHMPLGSDGLQSEGFFVRLANAVGGIVLPMIFLGPDNAQPGAPYDYYGMDMLGFKPGPPQRLEGSAYWVDMPVYDALIDTILHNLARAGFKIVVAHGHGPSTWRWRERIPALQAKYGLRLFHCFDGDGPEGQNDPLGLMTDHAGANETSLVMALHPDLVHMEHLSPDPAARPVAILGEDPRYHASPEFGEKLLGRQFARMSGLLQSALEEVGVERG
jgi:creatinine amidohydrolase